MKETAIEFPCDYPVKIIGEYSPGFLDEVIEIVRRHDASVGQESVTERSSRHGNYHSITVLLRATGEAQLRNLFEELKTCRSVRMVL